MSRTTERKVLLVGLAVLAAAMIIGAIYLVIAVGQHIWWEAALFFLGLISGLIIVFQTARYIRRQ